MTINIQNVTHDPKNMLEELSGMSSYKKRLFHTTYATSSKNDFSWNLIFSTFVLWMSSYKDEFLNMKTQRTDVKKHF